MSHHGIPTGGRPLPDEPLSDRIQPNTDVTKNVQLDGLSRPRRPPFPAAETLNVGIHTRTFYRTCPGIELTLSDHLAGSVGVGFRLSGFLRSFRLCPLASLGFGHFLSTFPLPQLIMENETASVVLLVRS